MFSSAREPSVTVYPDSDKIGVWPGNADDRGDPASRATVPSTTTTARPDYAGADVARSSRSSFGAPRLRPGGGRHERPQRYPAGTRAPQLPLAVARAVRERDRRQHRARRAGAVRHRAHRQRHRPRAHARRPGAAAGRVPADRRRLGGPPAAPPRDDRHRPRALRAARAARRADLLRHGADLAGDRDRGAVRQRRGVLPPGRQRPAAADGPRGRHPAGDRRHRHRPTTSPNSPARRWRRRSCSARAPAGRSRSTPRRSW